MFTHLYCSVSTSIHVLLFPAQPLPSDPTLFPPCDPIWSQTPQLFNSYSPQEHLNHLTHDQATPQTCACLTPVWSVHINVSVNQSSDPKRKWNPSLCGWHQIITNFSSITIYYIVNKKNCTNRNLQLYEQLMSMSLVSEFIIIVEILLYETEFIYYLMMETLVQTVLSNCNPKVV